MVITWSAWQCHGFFHLPAQCAFYQLTTCIKYTCVSVALYNDDTVCRMIESMNVNMNMRGIGIGIGIGQEIEIGTRGNSIVIAIGHRKGKEIMISSIAMG